MSHLIIRDTREQEGQGWYFPEGTVVKTLKTGDYSLEGYEDQLCIERKGTLGEFAKNICEARFERELERMNVIPKAYLILEFTQAHIDRFPKFSGIPPYKWKYLRVHSKFIAKRLHEIEEKYPNIQIILAGAKGRQIVSQIFHDFIKAENEKAITDQGAVGEA